MTLNISRRALAAGILATLPTPGRSYAEPIGERLPTHAEFWRRLPLPFTPAQAFALLSPATQTEIGAAVIGMYLAEYISGEDHAERDRFLSDRLREEAGGIAHGILNRLDQRLWTLFPTLYGPDGDHPAWALKGGLAR